MIKGIGTDIVEINRIEQAVNRTPKFIDKIFSPREQQLESISKLRVESIAGNFAAKEAMSKALGTGFRGFTPRDISVLRDSQGKPYIELEEGAKRIANHLGIKHIWVTISHCKNYATATVVVEGSEKGEGRD